MIVFKPGKRVALLGAAAAVLLTVPALAQTTGTAPATQSSSASSSASGDAASSTSVPDVTTVTIFGKKRQPGDITQTQIDTHSATSCGFMNDYDPGNEDIVQDYLRDFGSDQDGNGSEMPTADSNGNLQNTDQTDPNAPGNHFKDNSPFGNVSQDNAANSNTLNGMQVGAGGVPSQSSGACGPADKAFAAGRNYIARNDTSLKDAFASFDARDYPKALDQFKKSYDKMGYDQAALMEGKMLLGGMGTTANTAQAVIWLKKVVDGRFDPQKDVQNFSVDDPNYMTTRSDAAMLLGKVYLTGWGTPRDAKQALHYYEKAAEFGFIPANHILGEFYEYGTNGVTDKAKAATYFTKAAHVGYGPAQYELGVAYYNGDGVTQDKPTAAAWLVEAAKHGSADALYAVGNMYDQGDTLPNDPAKAIVYFRDAAEQGHPDAEDALGLYFYTGTAVTKDLTVARKLFGEAARGRSADAMFNLAVMMANGEGGLKDMASAYVYMRLAQHLGVDKAGPAADELFIKMTPDEKARADSVIHPKAAGK